jgi:hypothetical protein
MDLWELAQQNADVLRFSTLFTARQVPRSLGDEEGIGEAIGWCREHGITHVYLEVFRAKHWAPDDVIERARDAFLDAGFLVSGCITPAEFAKQSTGWHAFSCFTADETQRVTQEMAERAARHFDVVMIDDFFCSDCTCAECRAARGSRSWSDYKRDLMLRVARERVIGPGRAVNPNVEFIIKYPAWFDMYQERGYDVAAESELFPRTWVGTETRGTDEGGRPDFEPEPQYQGYWLMRWLLGIGGGKCGGGWYDAIDTSPRFYVEQGRQTVLGGAPEAFLFTYGALREGGRRHGNGPADVAALCSEMPQHFELARLIAGREPRGLSGWKPPNSLPGPDRNLHTLLGMAGFPVTAAHAFEPEAPGFVFGCHVLHDPAWWEGLESAIASGRPIVTTPDFLKTVRAPAEGNRLDLGRLRERAVVVPALTERRTWPGLAALAQEELDALRDGACEDLGVRFHAPQDVSLYLFGDDVAVVESFRNEQVECHLDVDGWDGAEVALRIPADSGAQVEADGALMLPARSLVAFRRA